MLISRPFGAPDVNLREFAEGSGCLRPAARRIPLELQSEDETDSAAPHGVLAARTSPNWNHRHFWPLDSPVCGRRPYRRPGDNPYRRDGPGFDEFVRSAASAST